MKLLPALLFFALLSSVALAGVTVSVDKPFYNLGDRILSSYAVSTDADFSGLAKLSLECTNSSLVFYASPTNLFAGQTQSVGVLGLGVSSKMAGKCFVKADVSSVEGDALFDSSSQVFNVTTALPVSAATSKAVYKPSETVGVLGIVSKSYVSPASVYLTFLDNAYLAPVVNNSFAYSIKLPASIKSGKHSLSFAVNDSSGNSGSAYAVFEVEAVPSRLILLVSESAPKPGSSITANVSLFDQAGDVMKMPVSFSISNNKGEKLISGENTTPVAFAVNLASSLPPGTYTAKAASAGLEDASLFVIEPVEQLSVSFDNRTLTFSNTGNVDYNKELVVNLSGADNRLLLTRGVDLAPGAVVQVDLYKEVPSDDYEISFPSLPDAATFESKLEDERSASRKVADFLGVTGRVVPQSGGARVKSVAAPVMVISIILLLFVYYSRKKGSGKPKEPSKLDVESAEFNQRLAERRMQSKAQPQPPVADKELLSRDDESVRKWLDNLQKDKPFR